MRRWGRSAAQRQPVSSIELLAGRHRGPPGRGPYWLAGPQPAAPLCSTCESPAVQSLIEPESEMGGGQSRTAAVGAVRRDHPHSARVAGSVRFSRTWPPRVLGAAGMADGTKWVRLRLRRRRPGTSRGPPKGIVFGSIGPYLLCRGGSHGRYSDPFARPGPWPPVERSAVRLPVQPWRRGSVWFRACASS
jgi:hypothetical protein